MPRTADHDQRRGQIVSAAMRIALADGISAVTVAKVASGAGISVGLVQHYYAAKHHLVQALHLEVLGRADMRIAELVERGEQQGQTSREMASGALQQLLPLDADRRLEAQVRAEFAALALREEPLRRAVTASDRGILTRLAQVVDNGRACGEAPGATSPEAAALRLLITVRGLGELALHDETFDPTAALRATVAEVFPGVCRRAVAVAPASGTTAAEAVPSNSSSPRADPHLWPTASRVG